MTIDGREVVVACPASASPGDVLEIDVPYADAGELPSLMDASERAGTPYVAASDSDDDDGQPMETAEVVVPSECRPGDSFVVESSWGGLFEVQVPPGTAAGSTLFVELPLQSSSPQRSGIKLPESSVPAASLPATPEQAPQAANGVTPSSVERLSQGARFKLNV